MINIQLPFSKSLLSRLLILQSFNHCSLLPCEETFPHDIKILYHALQSLQAHQTNTLYLYNNGTAARFLLPLCACLQDHETILTGDTRLLERPVDQLVSVLNTLGADIQCVNNNNHLPIKIKGKSLNKTPHLYLHNPLSTQFVSALLLVGCNITTNISSPYITMTQKVIERFNQHQSVIERDWSSAAFWYEYVALHGGVLRLNDLTYQSLQGDKIVADLFTHFGVETSYDTKGVIISKTTIQKYPQSITIDFSSCPDLYPAIAMTCICLNIHLNAVNTDSLRFKESDRISSMEEIKKNIYNHPYPTHNDHRIAMALLCADKSCDNIMCINKSYPLFLNQLCKLQK